MGREKRLPRHLRHAKMFCQVQRRAKFHEFSERFGRGRGKTWLTQSNYDFPALRNMCPRCPRFSACQCAKACKHVSDSMKTFNTMISGRGESRKTKKTKHMDPEMEKFWESV